MDRRTFAVSLTLSMCGLSGCGFNNRDTNQPKNTENNTDPNNDSNNITTITTATNPQSGTGQLILYKSGDIPDNTSVHDAKNESFLDVDEIEDILIKGNNIINSNRNYPKGDLLTATWIDNRTKGKQIEEKIGYMNRIYVEYNNNTYILVYQIVEE